VGEIEIIPKLQVQLMKVRHQISCFEFDDTQNTKSKQAIRDDITTLLGRAGYELETRGDSDDRKFAFAALRLARLVGRLAGLKQRPHSHA